MIREIQQLIAQKRQVQSAGSHSPIVRDILRELAMVQQQEQMASIRRAKRRLDTVEFDPACQET